MRFHVVWNVNVVRNLPLASTPCIAWGGSSQASGLDFVKKCGGDEGDEVLLQEFESRRPKHRPWPIMQTINM